MNKLTNLHLIFAIKAYLLSWCKCRSIGQNANVQSYCRFAAHFKSALFLLLNLTIQITKIPHYVAQDTSELAIQQVVQFLDQWLRINRSNREEVQQKMHQRLDQVGLEADTICEEFSKAVDSAQAISHSTQNILKTAEREVTSLMNDFSSMQEQYRDDDTRIRSKLQSLYQQAKQKFRDSVALRKKSKVSSGHSRHKDLLKALNEM